MLMFLDSKLPFEEWEYPCNLLISFLMTVPYSSLLSLSSSLKKGSKKLWSVPKLWLNFNQNLSLYINSYTNTSSLSSRSLNFNSNMKFHVDSKANSHFTVLYSNIWQCFSHSLSNKWSKTPKTWKFGPVSIQKIFNTHLSPFNRWDFCFQSPFQIEASQNICLASVCKRGYVIITSWLTGVLPLLPLNSPLPTNYLKTTRNP